MIEMLFSYYLAAIPVVTAYAGLRGLLSERPELLRSSAVVFGHAVVLQAWNAVMAPATWQGYPFLFMAISLAVTLWLVCRVPAMKGNAVLGGSVLFGILASLIYGVHTLWHGPSPASDWNYWLAQITMGVANLLILLGWTHERSLGRLVGRVFRAIAGVVQHSFIGSVAR